MYLLLSNSMLKVLIRCLICYEACNSPITLQYCYFIFLSVSYIHRDTQRHTNYLYVSLLAQVAFGRNGITRMMSLWYCNLAVFSIILIKDYKGQHLIWFFLTQMDIIARVCVCVCVNWVQARNRIISIPLIPIGLDYLTGTVWLYLRKQLRRYFK